MPRRAVVQAMENSVEDAWVDNPEFLTPQERAQMEAYEAQERKRRERMDKDGPGKGYTDPDIEELAREAEARGVTGLPGARPHQAPDVWTLEQLEREMFGQEPVYITGDLFGDGRFLFTFRPIIGRLDIQKQFRKAENVDLSTGQGQYELAEGYAQVLYEALKGGEWPLQEEVEDEYGQRVLDPETGFYKTQPLPISLRAVERLRTDTVVRFFQAMGRAISGEVNAQPSSQAS